MRKFAIGTLLALAFLAATGSSALAAPTRPASKPKAGPYAGKFQGTVVGEDGSSAPLTVTLTHEGDKVAGVATIGQGLEVQTAYCGAAAVPSRTERISGQTLAGQPRRLEATSTFKVQGLPITVRFSSDVSTDGKTIQGTTTLDIPWFCGGDPVLTGTLHKVS